MAVVNLVLSVYSVTGSVQFKNGESQTDSEPGRPGNTKVSQIQ